MSVIQRLRYLKAAGPEFVGKIDGVGRSGPIEYDQKNGVGNVPFNQEINYRGFAVFMTPAMFLALVPSRKYPHDKVVQAMKDKPIASPFLDIRFDKKMQAQVVAHEGRGRMLTIAQTHGQIPVLVHCFPYSMRAHNLNLNYIRNFRNLATPEDAKVKHRGPNCMTQVWLSGKWHDLTAPTELETAVNVLSLRLRHFNAAEWWDKLSRNEKKQYLAAHPRSKIHLRPINPGSQSFSIIHRDSQEKIGTVSMVPQGHPFVDSVRLTAHRGEGLAKHVYNELEKHIGRPVLPSPLGLSDSATRFWKKRLSKLPADRAKQLLDDSLQAGLTYGIKPEHIIERLQPLMTEWQPKS